MAALVILSPHFDDAVLSCGGQLWEAWTRGEAARVITLFAGPPIGEPPPFARVQHRMWGEPPDANALRRAEDRAALARLGVLDVVHLDAPDAVYRLTDAGEPMYGSEAAIFGPIHAEEETLPARLADAVAAYLPDGALLLAPLGVGRHVDHQIARAVAETLRARGWRTAFYEELPYVEWGASAEIAAAEAAGWRVEAVPLSEEAMSAKVASMAYYRSQIPPLYGDDATMEARFRAVAAAAADGDGFAERRWWPENVEALER